MINKKSVRLRFLANAYGYTSAVGGESLYLVKLTIFLCIEATEGIGVD
jgi:hypothetical protein